MPLQLTPASHARSRGSRSYQEDRFFTGNLAEGFLCGVFDGHGGSEAAQTASEVFPALFAEAIMELPAEEALLRAFAQAHEKTKHLRAGCTASVAFIPNSCDRVSVGVLGDSPVVVKRDDGSVWVGPNHNVRSNKAEAEAAKGRGGAIIGGYLYASIHAPGLQMARVLGDWELDKVLSRVPEISTQPLWGLAASCLCAATGRSTPRTSAKKPRSKMSWVSSN